MKRVINLALAACILSIAFAQTADEDKAAKKAAKLKRAQQMESCIVLVNAANFHQQKEYEALISENANANKKEVMNKFLAQRTKLCMDNITESQIDKLQGYRSEPQEFAQWNDDQYSKLINIDLKSQPAPYKITEPEIMLVYEIEEATERIRSENTTKIQKEMGSTTIAGFDFASMGTM